jgi:2-polyprenyl-3-methyl-5-hydroxy-6-metoxy-1,4-benzoquinol methylase
MSRGGGPIDALLYTREIDLDDTNNAHTLSILAVAPGSRVLDIGCASGYVGRALRERGCTVWGVEIDADAAAVASDGYERVVVADAETLDFEREFAGLEFEAVMLLDVLEHLKAPEKTLQNVRPLLADGGRLVVSIPNVTHAAVRLELLSGRFRYRELGLLDRTHLRFFDRQGVEDLLLSGGFAPEEILRVTRELDETEFDLNLDEFSPDVVAAATAGEDARTYQFIVVAAPRETSGADRAPATRTASLAERLQAERDALKDLVREGTKHVEHLESEHAKHVEHLESEHAKQLDQLQLERDLLQNDLMIKEAYLAKLRNDLIVKEAHFTELRHDLMVKEAHLADLQALTAGGRRPNALRYRFTDAAVNRVSRVPFAYRSGRWLATKTVGKNNKRKRGKEKNKENVRNKHRDKAKGGFKTKNKDKHTAEHRRNQ